MINYKDIPINKGDIFVVASRLRIKDPSRIGDATIKQTKKKMPRGVMAQWATATRRQARGDDFNTNT